ncbi:MAG: uroporphyrinogen decarboxylase family protein [Clostridia bacterium]
MMTPKEVVKATLSFQNPDRLAIDLPEGYGSDMMHIGMKHSPDRRPPKGKDEWGAVWDNIGVSILGEVKDYPLKTWEDFGMLQIPDVSADWRWEGVEDLLKQNPRQFLLCGGISIYERVHFLRGLENTWIDIYENPDELCMLIDILTDINLYMVERYASYGADGFGTGDDWGLQNSLMISPEKWRAIWKPRYQKIFDAAHSHGMFTTMHSCGNITAILDDLIEIGLDCIQMDQQENMGLENLGKKYKGKITFYCPVDIQNTFAFGTLEQIRTYCHCMFHALGGRKGGFIAKWYPDPRGVGHRQEAIEAMSEEFLKLSRNVFGQ